MNACPKCGSSKGGYRYTTRRIYIVYTGVWGEPAWAGEVEYERSATRPKFAICNDCGARVLIADATGGHSP